MNPRLEGKGKAGALSGAGIKEHVFESSRGEWSTLGHGVHWDKGSTVCLFRDNLTVSHVS